MEIDWSKGDGANRKSSDARLSRALTRFPIFYPVTTEDYAVLIARDWNVPASGEGMVTRFEVLASYLARFKVREVGRRACQEFWIPAEELSFFNDAIVGTTKVVRRFVKGLDGHPSEVALENGQQGLRASGSR